MAKDKSLAELFQYAAGHQFGAFDRLLLEMEGSFTEEELWEAYLMRAQIKLYTTDLSLLRDVEIAGQAAGTPRFPLLSTVWKVDAPNRFVVFPKAPEALPVFLQSLPEVGERLAKWYGGQARIIVGQIQGEISYFTGEIKAALAFALEQRRMQFSNNTNAIMSLMLQYRCHLALGQALEAEQCMLDMIRLARTFPECAAPYQAFRDWVVITTSWNGDSPRFYVDKNGAKLPVLEDRLENIRNGSPQARHLELPFVEYAEGHYDTAYQIRQLYMDVFHAIYWHSVRDRKQADSYFRRLYEIEQASGIIMPFVECGEQVTSLLEYALENKLVCPRSWTEKILVLARQYEANLNKYQAIND